MKFIYLFILCIVALIVISLLTTGPSLQKIRGLTFGSATPEQKAETRAFWNKWDVINTIIIVSIIVAFYLYFC